MKRSTVLAVLVFVSSIAYSWVWAQESSWKMGQSVQTPKPQILPKAATPVTMSDPNSSFTPSAAMTRHHRRHFHQVTPAATPVAKPVGAAPVATGGATGMNRPGILLKK
jgi:hypothetical protein